LIETVTISFIYEAEGYML